MIKVSASQLEGWVFDPQPLSELPWRSLGTSVHINRPGKKHISGFGLPPIAVTKINNKKKGKINRSILAIIWCVLAKSFYGT